MALKLCTIWIMPPYFWPTRAEIFFLRGGKWEKYQIVVSSIPSDPDAALESMIIRNEDGSFSCGNCGKTMQRKKDLKRHVEVHLDAFHQCHICQKVSKTRSALAMHYSSTHKDMVSSPWSMKWPTWENDVNINCKTLLTHLHYSRAQSGFGDSYWAKWRRRHFWVQLQEMRPENGK